MIRPEIVDYFKDNLRHFPADELRRRLGEDGVSDLDIADSLRAALAPAAGKRNAKSPRKQKRLFFAAVVFLAAGAGMLFFDSSRPPTAPKAPADAVATGQKSVFLGHYGYVVHLPPGYSYFTGFKDPRKIVEVSYFCKTGTHYEDALDTGLYGPMGIVRLQARPSAMAGRTDGIAELSVILAARAKSQNQEYSFKNLQVGTLRGIEIDYQKPFAHVEAYLLGQKILFSFYAGKDDGIYRSILDSLRDEASEG
ncbi:MAG: hypothetical protein ACYCPQ_02720 [Elusimicrobiota bacterium]